MTETGTRRSGSMQVLPGPLLSPVGPEPVMNLLRVSTRPGGRGVIVVELTGEIDLTTAPRLAATLQTLQIPPSGLLVLLDLSRLDFCDVTGLNTMARSARMLAGRGARLALAAPPRPLRKLLEITRLDGYLELFPTLHAAGARASAGSVGTSP